MLYLPEAPGPHFVILCMQHPDLKLTVLSTIIILAHLYVCFPKSGKNSHDSFCILGNLTGGYMEKQTIGKVYNYHFQRKHSPPAGLFV